jgi:hypothetical protein
MRALVASTPEFGMSPFKFVILAGSTMLLTVPALANTDELPEARWQKASVRVYANYNIFVPAPSGDSDEARKARDNARRSFYEMARRECDLLREVLAKDCRLESLSTNVSRQYGPHQPEGFNVNGSVNMQIILK